NSRSTKRHTTSYRYRGTRGRLNWLRGRIRRFGARIRSTLLCDSASQEGRMVPSLHMSRDLSSLRINSGTAMLVRGFNYYEIRLSRRDLRDRADKGCRRLEHVQKRRPACPPEFFGSSREERPRAYGAPVYQREPVVYQHARHRCWRPSTP